MSELPSTNYTVDYDFRISNKPPTFPGQFRPLQPVFDTLFNFAQQVIKAFIPIINVFQSNGTAILPPFTLSTLPDVAASAGSIALITNGTSGKWLVYSNGTNWLYPDGSIAV